MANSYNSSVAAAAFFAGAALDSFGLKYAQISRDVREGDTKLGDTELVSLLEK